MFSSQLYTGRFELQCDLMVVLNLGSVFVWFALSVGVYCYGGVGGPGTHYGFYFFLLPSPIS